MGISRHYLGILKIIQEVYGGYIGIMETTAL